MSSPFSLHVYKGFKDVQDPVIVRQSQNFDEGIKAGDLSNDKNYC